MPSVLHSMAMTGDAPLQYRKIYPVLVFFGEIGTMLRADLIRIAVVIPEKVQERQNEDRIRALLVCAARCDVHHRFSERLRDRPKGGGSSRSGVQPAASGKWERPGAVASHCGAVQRSWCQAGAWRSMSAATPRPGARRRRWDCHLQRPSRSWPACSVILFRRKPRSTARSGDVALDVGNSDR